MTVHNESVFERLRRGVGLRFDTSGYWTYPALVKDDQSGQLRWLSLVLKTAPMREKKRTALFRPMAMVMTAANTGLVVRYDNFRIGHDPFSTVAWDTPVAMFPHQGIGELSYSDLADQEANLMAAYGATGESFRKTGVLPQSFRDMYVRLCHPVVLPYLKHLAPQFFVALGVEKA